MSINKDELLQINLNPDLAGILPEGYLKGRLDAAKRCPKGEHWVKNKRAKKGGYCRSSRKSMTGRNVAQATTGVLLAGVTGALVHSSKSKDKAQKELNRANQEVARSRKLNDQLKVANTDKDNNIENLTKQATEQAAKLTDVQDRLKSTGAELLKSQDQLHKTRKSLESAVAQLKPVSTQLAQKSKENRDLKVENARLINQADERLETAQKELTKTQKRLEKTESEVMSLRETLLTFPVPKPGGYVKDPRTNKRPVEPDDRNKDREIFDPSNVNWDDLKEAKRYKARIASSVSNAKEWRDIAKDKPIEDPKTVTGKAKKFLGNKDNQQVWAGKAVASAGGAIGSAVGGPLGGTLGSMAGGMLGRLMTSAPELLKAKEVATEEDLKILNALEEAELTSKEDLNNKAKVEKLRQAIIRDNVTALEGRSISELINIFSDFF